MTPDDAPKTMRPTIFLRCDVCGNACIVDRWEHDPPSATVCVTNECNICNAASGGFGECWYFDANGKEVTGDFLEATDD